MSLLNNLRNQYIIVNIPAISITTSKNLKPVSYITSFKGPRTSVQYGEKGTVITSLQLQFNKPWNGFILVKEEEKAKEEQLHLVLWRNLSALSPLRSTSTTTSVLKIKPNNV
jgi:hypothetical protein